MTKEKINELKEYLKGWRNSFAFQLLILHFRNRIFFLLPWILLFLWTIKLLHFDYGIPFLFVVPEYLGKENGTSYLILGMAFGIFTMVWHITSYLLESHKFPFMANLRHPFAMFCVNNSIIPIFFYLSYFGSLIHYGFEYDDGNYVRAVLMFCVFIIGNLISIILIAYYFLRKNSNIYKFIDQAIVHGNNKVQKGKLGFDLDDQYKWHVETYFSLRFQTRPTRQVIMYDVSLVSQVFKQHHYNFFIFQIAIIVLLILVGFLVEIPYFQIPAACSLVLALTLMTTVFGLFKFWTGKWSTAIFVIFFILLNYAYKFGFTTHENKAYGLNYNQIVNYNQSTFDSMTTDYNIEKDKLNTIQILNRWKLRNINGLNKGKPKMIIIMASGGGLSSALFTSRVVQICNQTLDNSLLSNTTLLAGASGGIIGLAYMRELYLNQMEFGDINARKYAKDIAQDLLNPMCVTNLTHDIFYPLRTYTFENQVYKKDRTYLFEWKLNKNVKGLFSRQIKDYKHLESSANIPLLFNNATIVNDYKQIIISSQPVRYMMKPKENRITADHYETDMIDFCSLFKNSGGDLLKLSTVIRINATYPLILPAVNFPTIPEISAIDGGMRDNNGSQIVYRFMDVFQDWINENTSGVIILQIKYFPKFKVSSEKESLSQIEKVTNPLRKIYTNIFELQDYEQDQLFSAANQFLKGKLDVIRFEYNGFTRKKEGSLSFHLTDKEKEDILNCAENMCNQKGYKELKKIMQPNN